MRLLAFLVAFSCCYAVIRTVQIDPPQLPQVEYDTTYSAPTQKVSVAAGESIQAAIDAASLGTVIELEAGATWNLGTSSIVLRKKEGSGWIYIQTSAYNSLPKPGARVQPSDSQHMPKLVADGVAAITVENGAHHYRLVGLEITSTDKYVNALIELGIYDNGITQADLSDHIVLDRVYAWAGDTVQIKRGLGFNCNSGAVVDSYFAGFKASGADSQAIAGWIGRGPYVIDNNFLEGGSENLIFGGADPQSSLGGPIASDVYIRRNHLFKRLSWFGSSLVVVKNLLELKAGRRILIEGNVMENNWLNGQVGRAIVLTPRNQDGGFPEVQVADITVRNNIVHTTCSAVGLLSYDDIHGSLVTTRILIENNLFYNVSSRMCDGGGVRGFLLTTGGQTGVDWIIRHNTLVPESGTSINTFALIGDNPIVVDGLQFNDNLAFMGEYAFHSPQGTGVVGLNYFALDWEMRNNLLVGDSSQGRFFPNDTIVADGTFFRDFPNNDLRWVAGSPLLGTASDGTNPGADLEQIVCACNPTDLTPGLELIPCTTVPISTPLASDNPLASQSPEASPNASPLSSPVSRNQPSALSLASLMHPSILGSFALLLAF